MTVRRAAAALALPLALLACAPEVEQEAPPQEIVKAVFDSATATIPLPNDLALQSAAATPGGAGALLQLFVGGGGWPNDQEVAIDVPVQRLVLQGDDYVPAASPATIDLATVNPSTVALLRIDSGTPVAVPFEAVYAPLAGSFGNLRLRAAAAADGSRHWAPGGRYVVALRGGSAGVKTTDGRALSADLVTSFITQGKDLTVPEFQPPGLPPSLAGQLEQLRQLYASPLTWVASGTSWIPQSAPDLPPAFAAVDTVFPSREAASIQTFGVEDGTHVAGDPDAGQIPLPSDFLLDPSTGRVQFLPDAFGPAAAGLATLDGFSTTGILLAPTTGPIDALSVARTSVLVFETGGAFPVWQHDLASALGAGDPGLARYVTQPPDLNAVVGGTTVSSTIGLQPGVPVSIPGVGDFFLPPLEESTTYVVVVTDRVLDAEGRPLKRGTLGKLLFTYEGDLDELPIFADDPTTAAGLEALRAGLEPLLDALPALTGDPELTKDDVVMAYPVTTQTVTEVSVGLSALPYDPNQDGNPADSVIFAPQNATAFDPADLGYPGAFPNVVAFYESAVTTLDAIDVTTGALQPNPALWAPKTIPALVAVPDPANPNIPACPGGVPLVCAPLAVFHHGLGGGRLTALPFVDALAAQGFVVVAIDAPLHGDRAFCDSAADCVTGGTCTPIPGAEGQGDAVPPGTCDTGLAFDPARLTTVASGNYFVSANFFRTRDAIRQDLLDHAALVLALARPPAPFPQPAANPLATALAGHGVAIDPTRVYLDGISLGGVVGTQIAAANPRFSRAVLSVAGGTLVDALTNSPAFDAQIDALFLSLGIDRSEIATDPAVAARYLQTLLVAKWVLDPAEPLNYAAHVPTKLPSPLHAAGLGPLASTTTAAFGQVANCDQVIPNPFNLLLFENGGIPYTFYVDDDPVGGCVPHGFLGSSAVGQGHAAQFLFDGVTVPASPFPVPVP